MHRSLVVRLIAAAGLAAGAIAAAAAPASAAAPNPFASPCDGSFASNGLYHIDHETGSNLGFWDDECSLGDLREMQ